MNRRRFLEGAGVFTASLVGGTLAHPSQAASTTVTPQSDDDGDFWKRIRSEFPLGDHRIYLNTGGLGASPRVAIEAVKTEMDKLEYVAETGRSASLWQTVKTTAGALLGCPARNIAYTRNATEGINIVCNGLPLVAGDEVITSSHEHVANTITWLARQRFDGIRLRVFEPSMRSAQENLDRIERLITPRTRVLSLPHVTTATGQVLPVEEIGALATHNDLWYFVDGAQAPGMMPVDVERIGCHAYATSGHKWLLGPKGTGLLYVRDDTLERIRPRWVGAYSASGEPDMMRSGDFLFSEGAQRYEFGTVSVPLFVGLGAAMRFLSDIGMARIWERNHHMARTLMTGLEAAGAKVLSPQHPDEHSAMVTFRSDRVPADELQSVARRALWATDAEDLRGITGGCAHLASPLQLIRRSGTRAIGGT
jgi:cysteine desulfurase/selenocysteine lyase